MTVKIEELSKENLEEAVDLVHRVFVTNPADADYPDKWFPASLNPETEENKKLYEDRGVVEVKYFVAVKNERVVGTTGYYTLGEDVDDAYWLGWFCVAPEHRKEGIGKKLFEFILDKAKKSGKKFLRLYTTDSDEEKDAQLFYDKVGLKIYKTEDSPYERSSKVMYRELNVS